jgi:hypothetical protein
MKLLQSDHQQHVIRYMSRKSSKALALSSCHQNCHERDVCLNERKGKIGQCIAIPMVDGERKIQWARFMVLPGKNRRPSFSSILARCARNASSPTIRPATPLSSPSPPTLLVFPCSGGAHGKTRRKASAKSMLGSRELNFVECTVCIHDHVATFGTRMPARMAQKNWDLPDEMPSVSNLMFLTESHPSGTKMPTRCITSGECLSSLAQTICDSWSTKVETPTPSPADLHAMATRKVCQIFEPCWTGRSGHCIVCHSRSQGAK